MAKRNIGETIGGLASDKIKERTECIQAIRSHFSTDWKSASRIEPKVLRKLLEGVFGSVEKERLLLVKARSKTTKGGSSETTVSKRLVEAGKAVRVVVEKTMGQMVRREVILTLNRLFRVAEFERDLFPHVGLDYLKALKHVAGYRPHLDHFQEDDWVKSVQVCFNVILGESLSTEMSDTDDGHQTAMDVDSESDREDDDELPSTQNSRKRTAATHDYGRAAPTKRRRQQISVTAEQVDCAAMLSILLQTSNSPLANTSHGSEYSCLTSAILDRLYRILATYPGESSILYDYLEAVSFTLDRVAFNAIKEVRTFAYRTWNSFIQLLDVKDKRIKERLLIVIRHLFPFIPSPTEIAVPGSRHSTLTFHTYDALGDLWDKLDKECENKWGVGGLNLDFLRLEIVDDVGPSDGDNPFVASTFRAGWNFDSGQALSWATIELQADCAREMYTLSEPATPRAAGKRNSRIQNPVASLLNTMYSQPTTQSRRYHLQVLLFFIDRHWTVLPDDMKHDIATTLLQFVNVDDPEVQPWIFLNLAAVAFAERRCLESNPDLLKPSQQIEVLGPQTWDAVWTHAVRRSNAPGLCRAACHAAHALLVSLFRFTPPSGHIFLTSQQVIQDIETIGKDLDYQGPSFPYDSVCMFLTKCLRIASQDVRLYKTQLEDKVSKWLSDSWTVTGATRDTIILNTVSDILILLESIAGLSKQTDLHFRFVLPLSPIVDSMRMEKRLKIVRDYLLSASLPSCTHDDQPQPSATSPTSIDQAVDPGAVHMTPSSNDVRLEARPRERKVSAYFARTLDTLLGEWKSRVASTSHIPVEAARQALDFAIAAIAFECALTVNSTLSNSRVLKTAGELLSGIVVYTKESRWTLPEKMSILLGLETIVSASGAAAEGPWEAIAPSDYDNDGMARKERVSNHDTPLDLSRRRRNALLRAIWQSNDLQTSLKLLTDTVRSVVDAASTTPAANSQSFEMDDGFGPIRTSATSAVAADATQATELYRQLYEIYIPILTRGPLLQSSSGQPTRDRQLIERLLEATESNQDWFLMVAPLVLREIESGALECNFNQAAELFKVLGSVLQLYPYSLNPSGADLTIQLAQSTLSLWSTSGSISDADLTNRASKLVAWFAGNCQKGLLRAWETRDKFIRFLEKYVESDPSESVWQGLQGDKVKILQPTELLATLTADPDIRVRFRAAVAVPRLLVTSQAHSGNLVGVYTTKISNALPANPDIYEEMITRLLTVANIMVVSSAVRRGAYWNLLEICHKNSTYATHIQQALEAVVSRLGMPTLVSLFEAYAFQLSISMSRNDIALWEFPPSLLGFKDRSSCIETAFRAFVPAYILFGQFPTLEVHCKNLSKDPRDAQRECFGDAVGFFATAWYDNDQNRNAKNMEEALEQTLFDATTLQMDISDNVDGIAAAILRTLGDQDTSAEGPVVHALNRHDPSGEASQVFSYLVRYRKLYSFDTHEPNLPKCNSKSVVHALGWLATKVPETFDNATIYHVFHALFACIEETPLVNEKYRLLNALCMWISMTYKVIVKHPNLLQTLVHGVTSLLSQHVLARSAQSILEWSFRVYRNEKISDARMSSVLVRICGIGHDYSKSTQGPLARLGADLSTWIDEQAFALCQVKIIAERVMNALPAWARNPTGALADLSADIGWSNIEKIFKEGHGGPNKFRVVRRLKDYVSNKTSVFQKDIFWRLKESIPTAERLHEEDAIAFTDLLLDNYGRIDSLSAELPEREMQTIRMRHRRQTKGSGSHEAGLITDARDSIIYGLLMLLEDESPTLVHTAYKTLRLMLAALPIDPVKSKAWQPVNRDELRLLQSYPSPLLNRPVRDLSVLKSAQYVEGSAKFSSWVTHLAKLIADIMASEEGYASFGQLYPILSIDVATAEQALPVLILCLLTHEQQKRPPETQWKETLSEFFTNVLLFPGSCLPVVRCIVETVIHLRYFQIKAGEGAARLTCNQWLDIDFTTLAKSAVRCGAYTTAVLFLDLAGDQDDHSILDSGVTEQIQYEIYAHIDEPDGFYGIKTTNPTQFLVQRLHHEKQWDKAFRFHGAMLEAQPNNPTSSDTSGLLESFNAFGFNTLAMQTLRQTDSRSVSHDKTGTAMSYKLGWRSETWDLPDRDTYCSGAPLYNALRAMYRERDPKTIDAQLRRSFYREVDQLRRLGIESVAEIKAVLQSMMCLDQILRWRNAPTAGQDGNGVELPQWPDFEKISPEFEFADLENVMSTRIALVRSVRQKEAQRRQIGDILSPSIEACVKLEQQCLLSMSRAARDTNQTQIALNSIVKAQRLGVSSEVSQEYAKVLWSLNEPKLAVDHLADMVNKVAPTDSKLLKPTLLARLGTWTSEACLQKPTEIWNTYFEPARKYLTGIDAEDTSKVAEVFHQCAAFADKQYNAINRSPDMIRRKVYIQRKEQEIEERSKQLSQLSQGHNPNRLGEVKKAQELAKKVLDADTALHQGLKGARDEFLKQALVLYSQCLCMSEVFDDEAPIKFSSLWFANFDDEVVKEKLIQQALGRIPSRKFIFLAHQLTARMTKEPPANQKQNQICLQRLIVRLCQEHPFHSLYQVYCVRADTVPSPPFLAQSQVTRTDRSDAADAVLASLRDDEAVGTRVRDVEKACDAYLQWAKYPASKTAPQNQKIPAEMKIRALKRLKIPVLTADTKVDPSMRYENCLFIRSYKETYDTAGGLNLPKITVCIDEQGQQHKQLFKGNDDMRQDAVMEQVFELVNNLLYVDRETCRRNLRVRTYKVIPLGTQAGVLEFVPDTAPLRNWLYKAHETYRRNDWTPSKTNKHLSNVQKSPVETRLKAYKEARRHIRPIFRHYFAEKHKTPLLWFAMRLRYTRSVATTSIVGNILGLGDRHTSNILLHAEGEVVHIDLGIAFDQGKLLPVPELVPFRLTRDMVDGMGVSGTRGVFQRCSEETLRVLREGSDIIMSVLEVFKHDPLHSWTANEVKIRRVQQDVPVTPSEFAGIGIDMNSGTAEEAADRALSSVERKLDKSLSVETTVNTLIAEATDINNLAVIFPGWGPHL